MGAAGTCLQRVRAWRRVNARPLLWNNPERRPSALSGVTSVCVGRIVECLFAFKAWALELLELCVLRLRLLEDGNIRVSVFPKSEKVPVVERAVPPCCHVITDGVLNPLEHITPRKLAGKIHDRQVWLLTADVIVYGRSWNAVFFGFVHPRRAQRAGTLTTESGPALLIILDQHRVGLVRAAREGQVAVAGPIEREDLVRSEMRHWFRRAALDRLFPDVAHAI